MNKEEKTSITILKTLSKSVISTIPGIVVSLVSLWIAKVAINKKNK